MIKLKIERYRDYTQEEIEAREKKDRYPHFTNTYSDDYISEQRPVNILDVEITDEQFEAIRKAVLEKF